MRPAVLRAPYVFKYHPTFSTQHTQLPAPRPPRIALPTLSRAALRRAAEPEAECVEDVEFIAEISRPLPIPEIPAWAMRPMPVPAQPTPFPSPQPVAANQGWSSMGGCDLDGVIEGVWG